MPFAFPLSHLGGGSKIRAVRGRGVKGTCSKRGVKGTCSKGESKIHAVKVHAAWKCSMERMGGAG